MSNLYEPLLINIIEEETPVIEVPTTWKRLIQNRAALLGLLILCLVTCMAIFVPLLSSYSYFQINLEAKNQSPNWEHWFGTDDLGRDLFTRIWYGARISLSIGIAAAFIDVIFGIFWGSLAAYAGGKVDELMMRFADILYSLPYLLVVIFLSLVLGSGFFSILAAMTILGWISMSRIVRAQVRHLKEQGYILAAVALGAGFPRILIKHLIPNAFGQIIVALTTSIPSAIFVEAFLSFLGLGIQAPLSSWGSMAHDGLPALSFYPWRLFFPTFAICLTILAFNLIGDALTDLIDQEYSKNKN